MITEALKRLNPAEVARGTDYVDRATPGHPGAWPWPKRFELLVAAGGRPKLLVAGSIGVGKTTELARWAQALSTNHLVQTIALRPGRRPEPTDILAGLVGMIRRGADRWEPDADLDEDQDTRPLMDQVEAIRERVHGDPMLLVVDGMDRMPADDVAALFGPGSVFARDELPPMVISAPASLLTMDLNSTLDAGFDQVVHLPAFPVVREDGTIDHRVVAHLADGLKRRLDALGVVGDDSVYRRAALHAGGVPRDAVRILRGACLAALDDGQVQPHHLFQGEREVRQDLEQALTELDVLALRQVSADPMHRPDAKLVTSNAVLAYEGPTRRYHRVHPLLTELVDGTGMEGLFGREVPW